MPRRSPSCATPQDNASAVRPTTVRKPRGVGAGRGRHDQSKQPMSRRCGRHPWGCNSPPAGP
eukprot:11194185-Lingulodinium_polyedra.AAC.1